MLHVCVTLIVLGVAGPKTSSAQEFQGFFVIITRLLYLEAPRAGLMYGHHNGAIEVVNEGRKVLDNAVCRCAYSNHDVVQLNFRDAMVRSTAP